MKERLVQNYLRNIIEWNHIEKNMKCVTKTSSFPVLQQQTRAFWVKYLGSDYRKIQQIVSPKLLKCLLALEQYNAKHTHCILDTNTTVYCDI